MTAILAFPETPAWAELDRRHALVGLASYRGDTMWAYYDDASNVTFTVWEEGAAWRGVLTGLTRTGWGACAVAALRRMVLLHPAWLFQTTMPRAKPAMNRRTPVEKFVWGDCALTDMGLWNTDGVRNVEASPSAVLARLVALGF